MDEHVKRRLIGAGIISILAVIIVPYFFEDKAPRTATELPLPVASQSLALPKDEGASTEKVHPEGQESQAQKQLQPPKKRTYTTVPLEDTKESSTQVPPAASEEVAQAPAVEEFPEEPTSENRAPVILDPKAPQGKAPPTPKLQHPATDIPPARVLGDAQERPKPPAKKPEPPKMAKPPAPPASNVADAPVVKKPVAPVEAPKKPTTASVAAPALVKPTPSASVSSAAKPTTPSSYLVQAGTFSDENNAKTLVEKLKKRNLPVRIQVVEGLNGKVYRVTVGPNLDHARAEQIQKQLSEQDGVRGLILQGH